MSESDPDRVDEEIAEAISALPMPLQEIAASLPFPALHHACMLGHLDLIRALLNAGLPVDLYPETEDEDDQPPLTWLARDRATASANALQVASLLIQHSEDVDEGNPLAAALEAGDISMVRLLLAAGANEEFARNEVGPSEAALLNALSEPYWGTAVGDDPRYFVAFDSFRTICAAGFSASDAVARAHSSDERRSCQSKAATEQLIAAFLRGDATSWFDKEGVADLDIRRQ